MTVFAKATMDVAVWGKVQDLVGEFQMKLGGPHDLMMFSVDSVERLKQDIFIGLPDSVPLSLFPEFTRIDRADLPDYLATLVAREDGFAERFPDIAAKRRVRFG
jgi:hypothetical protein